MKETEICFHKDNKFLEVKASKYIEAVYMVTIEICVGSACHLKGSYHVVNRFQEIVKNRSLEKDVEIKAAFCLGRCTESVSVRVNNEKIHSVSPEQVDEFFEKEILSLIR